MDEPEIFNDPTPNIIEERPSKSRLKQVIKRWKQYSDITDLLPIMRRFFVMNAFDGVLTALGLIIGNFTLFLQDPGFVSRTEIVILGLATTLAIGVSGYIGAAVSEKAEMRKANLELLHEMATNPEFVLRKKERKKRKRKKKSEDNDKIIIKQPGKKQIILDNPYPKVELKEDSITEIAEKFANRILSVTEGFSPAIGSILGLLPFFFAEINLSVFIISFLLELILLFVLGVFLGKVAEESKIKSGILMVLAGIVSAIISYVLGGNPNVGN